MSEHPWYQMLNKEASIGGAVQFLIYFSKQIISRYKLLLVLILVGASLGLLFSLVKPVKRSAELIIAAEEAQASGFEGLMSQFGLEMGGANPGGIFQGESLVKVFMTRGMIERALLTKVYLNGDSVILAQYLLPMTKYGKKEGLKDVVFNEDRKQHNSLTDSVLYLLQKHAKSKIISVVKPDKRQGIIHVKAVHRDGEFARLFATSLLENVSEFYVETLTKKARSNLTVLQAEADSVQMLLNENLSLSAYASDLNINPVRQSLRIDQNRKLIDLQVSVSLYGEIVKNLKLAEISLRKQTPLIQVIDRPLQPLEIVGYRWWEWCIIGGIFGLLGALVLVYLDVKRQQDAELQRIEA